MSQLRLWHPSCGSCRATLARHSAEVLLPSGRSRVEARHVGNCKIEHMAGCDSSCRSVTSGLKGPRSRAEMRHEKARCVDSAVVVGSGPASNLGAPGARPLATASAPLSGVVRTGHVGCSAFDHTSSQQIAAMVGWREQWQTEALPHRSAWGLQSAGRCLAKSVSMTMV